MKNVSPYPQCFLFILLAYFYAKLITPQSDRLIADGNAPFCQQILDITVAEIKFVIEPYGITNDIRWESVKLVSIHPEIILYRELSCQYRKFL